MVMRIGGLASGMDIDSIVEKLMQAEKAPLNKLYQNKQKYEWQRDAYRDVNKQLQAFNDFMRDEMLLQKDFYKKTVVSTNSAVSAVPTTAENGQTLTIDSVNQLAKAGNAVGTIDPTKSTMSELGLTSDQNVKMQVLQTDGSMKEVKFEVKVTDTVDQVVAKLKKDTGLNAFYDKASGKISIATKATGKGEENEFETTVTSGSLTSTALQETDASVFVSEGTNVFNALGFGDSPDLITNGQNAKLTINGAEIERKSNTFDIDGFKITLNNTYSGTNTQPIDLTTKVDADHMVDKIKKFVETYNGLVDSLTAMTKEPRYRDYAPLTDEQKDDMEESEITSWEKKAKSGVLRGDSLLRDVLGSMRSIMYTQGGGKQDVRASDGVEAQNFINTLYEMGITTSDKMSDNGKLVIKDEAKLREAIEKDPEQIYKTFSDPLADNGLVQKLRKTLDKTVKQIEKKAGKADSTNISFQIGRQLKDTDNRIDTWKVKLAKIEERYWKQFNAMEQAINNANQQSSSLFSGQSM